jgi:hypothetical protein
VADVKMLDEIVPEAGAFYVMDRGYIDFERLFVFSLSAAFFVVRTKNNVLLQRRYSHEVDKSTGVCSDHTVILTAIHSIKVYPDALRRVSYVDQERTSGSSSLPTTLSYPPFPSPGFTSRAGQWNYSSSGSNSICGSRHFTA